MKAASGRVLIIAGSDSGGGAGIQGDIKTVTCLGGYAASAITALTAQNTLGVQAILPIAPDFIAQQIESVMSDIGADSFKSGMLHSASVIEKVASEIRRYPNIPYVLDPVMFAKGGAALLEKGALAALKNTLIPLATIITPNIPEAEFLSGMTIGSTDDMPEAARAIQSLGCRAVLLKGGHLEGDALSDLLMDGEQMLWLRSPKRDTPHTHGTGCTLASAIATGLAQGMPLAAAVKRAHGYVQQAITHAPQLGNGHGPLGHGFTVGKFNGN
ncbi:MAG: bifunctional hydroxymethylpyrimidine kinase/phosphomethylpyrimidine kinase [Alphaproteobacteria bacterium]|nr:bifunctional hydroxymethylpyrimidine kinase/phosphomethylpyrimidine kinase [Alphaproteobacteria bacterium]